jgi:lipid-A-disaccharide synthase
MALNIFLVAGEASGDRLGAGLIRAIRESVPDANFEGVAGPAMIEAGCKPWLPSQALAVMGLTEVIRHLPRLLRLRRQLGRRLLERPPDVFVGIDAPDFNLGLERRLKRAGVPTAHYVSPSIWAWRPGRAKKMATAADRVLCLLPFEPRAYQDAGVEAVFVGHPLADAIPEQVDGIPARAELGLPSSGPVVAVLPGSRVGELRALGGDFAGAIGWLHRRRPELRFIAPMASRETRALFAEALAARAPGAPVKLIDGLSREAMAAADVVLLASGTASLEAALIKRPMVVAYRLSRMSQWLLETFKLVQIRHFALPNLLAGRELVPELLQAAVTPSNLGEAVLAWLDDTTSRDRLVREFETVHRSLRQDADQRAALAVLDLCPGQGRESR